MTNAIAVDTLTVWPVTKADLPSISDLEARAYGPGRFARTAYRIREGLSPLSPYARVLRDGDTIKGSIRFTPVTVGGRSGALLLGPLTVEPGLEGRGLGRLLIHEGLSAASKGQVELVILVGDEPYYGRHGFARVPPGQITFPGPVDPARILACALSPDALSRFNGPLAADSDIAARS